MTTTMIAVSTKLPVHYNDLIALGLTHEQIVEASKCEPLRVGFLADKQPGAYFDVARAAKALKALGNFSHTTGRRWQNLHFRLGEGLSAWQVVWVLAPIFGWVYFDEEVDDVVRVIRNAWIEVPRKNGKSTLSSAIANILFLADGEVSPEVYMAASTEAQAGRVFNDAKRMLNSSKAALKRATVFNDFVRHRDGGVMKALTADAGSAHGLNISGAVIDEVHVFAAKAGRDLVEAIETGTPGRDQPLVILITTADEDTEGTIYAERHDKVVNIANGVITDAYNSYGVIWGASDADIKADPFSDEILAKANPGAGSSPTWKYLRDAAKDAKNTPSKFPAYCRLHLNYRMRDKSLWLDLHEWDTLTGQMDTKTDLRRRAWAGLDLSAGKDFNAYTVMVESKTPGKAFDTYSHFWIPEDRVKDLERELQVPLTKWIKDGHVTATPGSTTDFDAIRDFVLADMKRFNFQKFGIDRMFAIQLAQEIQNKVTKKDFVVQVNQGFAGMSPGSTELEHLIGRKILQNDGNPVMRWMVSKVEAQHDNNGLIRPVKPQRHKSSSRIDGVAALVMALDGYVRREDKKKPMIYTTNNTRR